MALVLLLQPSSSYQCPRALLLFRLYCLCRHHTPTDDLVKGCFLAFNQVPKSLAFNCYARPAEAFASDSSVRSVVIMAFRCKDSLSTEVFSLVKSVRAAQLQSLYTSLPLPNAGHSRTPLPSNPVRIPSKNHSTWLYSSATSDFLHLRRVHNGVISCRKVLWYCSEALSTGASAFKRGVSTADLFNLSLTNQLRPCPKWFARIKRWSSNCFALFDR